MAKTKTTDIEEAIPAKTMSMNARQNVVASLANLDDLAARLGGLQEWSDFEESFDVVTKDSFDGVPIVIGAFRLNESDKFARKNSDGTITLGRFMSLLVAPFDENTGAFTGPWVIVNDGSTGIMQQLIRSAYALDPNADATRDNFNAVAAEIKPIIARKGFRASEYDYDDGDTVLRATTWYIG